MTLQDIRAALVGRTLCFDDDGIPAAFRIISVIPKYGYGLHVLWYTFYSTPDRESRVAAGTDLDFVPEFVEALVRDGQCRDFAGDLYTLAPLNPSTAQRK